MTLDEYNKLKSIKMTLDNAFAQKDIFWVRDILASALLSYQTLLNAGAKQHPDIDTDKMTPCPDCNPYGTFRYSPAKDCRCGGHGYLPTQVN